MEKTIKLGEKEYRLHSFLFTIIDYLMSSVPNFSATSRNSKRGRTSKKKTSRLSSTRSFVSSMCFIVPSARPPTDFLMSLDFAILSDPEQLSALSGTIGDMLGTLKKGQSPSPQL